MMRRNASKPSVRIAILVVAFSTLFGTLSFAQSGRKQKRPEAQPPVQGINQPDARVAPEPTVEVAPKPKDVGPGVIVASELTDIGMSNVYTDAARQGCIAELRAAHVVDLQEARDQNRAEATKKAKEAEVFVLLLELRVDSMSSSSGRYSFELRYALFEPKTGKVINNGAGYPTSPDMRSPSPPNSYDYEQRQVELMGRDAGRKALKFIMDRAPRKPLTADLTDARVQVDLVQ